MVQPGDDLAALIADGFARAGEAAAAGDVLVVAQKIVSKSEGRYANLAEVEPGAEARELAARADKDPRMVELILSESRRVVRHRPGVIIVEHRLGFVMANAGIDNSNVEPAGADERVLLLPARSRRQRATFARGVAGTARHGLRRDRQRQCRTRLAGGHRGPRAGRCRTAVAARSSGARRSLRPAARSDPSGAGGRARRRRLAAAGRGRRGHARGGGARACRCRAGNDGAALIRNEADDLFR